MRTFISGVIAASALVAMPTQLAAQNVHTSLLYEQILENIDITLPGYILDSFGIVRLTPGETSRISLDVPTERTIEIMGDCDDDCYDLDLIVYNSSDKVLAKDTEDDYYPIVDFSSKEDGRIVIELKMEDCDANYCYAAYSVFISPES